MGVTKEDMMSATSEDAQEVTKPKENVPETTIVNDTEVQRMDKIPFNEAVAEDILKPAANEDHQETIKPKDENNQGLPLQETANNLDSKIVQGNKRKAETDSVPETADVNDAKAQK